MLGLRNNSGRSSHENATVRGIETGPVSLVVVGPRVPPGKPEMRGPVPAALPQLTVELRIVERWDPPGFVTETCITMVVVTGGPTWRVRDVENRTAWWRS